MPFAPAEITAYGLYGYQPTNSDWPGELYNNGFVPLDYLETPPAYHDSVATAQNLSAARKIVYPSVKSLARDATITKHYTEDYYNRIHVAPHYLGLGNILSVQTRDFYVWNAYFEARDLLSTAITNGDGIQITNPGAPTTFAALEEREYEATVSLDGPPTVNASILFVFQDDESGSLRIIGSRVVLFPWVPDRGFTERLVWLTDILKTRQGEQRIAMRNAPRQAFRFSCLLDSRQFSAAKIMGDMWQYRVWGLPIWNEAEKTSVSIGDEEIIFDTANADWRANGLGAVWQSDTEFEVFEVDEVFADRVTVKRPMEAPWTDVFVFPVRLARTPGGIELNRHAPEHSRLIAEFLVEDSRFLGQSDFIEYDGYEVYDDPNYRVSDISERIHLPQKAFDNGQGPVVYEMEREYPDMALTLGKIARHKAGIWRWRQWLHSCKGKLKPFLLPSWAKDLKPVEPITDVQTRLVCKATGLPLYGNFPLRIRIEAGGSVYYRKVTGADNAGDGKENVFLDANLGTGYDPGEFKRISYLHLVRLNTDQVEMRYEGYLHNRTTLPLMRVPA